MSIELKIEKQYLYSVMKALKAKNDQVCQLIVKNPNDFYLFYSFNLKDKSTKFIYSASFLIQINN
jgi:predicted TIM-barrel fold metal-dependent hydrolase